MAIDSGPMTLLAGEGRTFVAVDVPSDDKLKHFSLLVLRDRN